MRLGKNVKSMDPPCGGLEILSNYLRVRAEESERARFSGPFSGTQATAL